MKRILLMSFFLLAALSAWSKNFTPAQQKLQDDILTFLRVEGFMPEIDSDEDIKFKYEGRTYYISVSDNDTSPLYVAFFIEYGYDDTYTKEKILQAQQSVNFYKVTKMICYDTAYSLRGEMYLTSAEQFKYVFYKLLSQIDNMRDELRQLCAGS